VRRTVFAVAAVAALAGAVPYMASASGQSDGDAAPIFGRKIPSAYRDWSLISVAHEAGSLNDLRAILGNDVAVKAYRDGKLPFPDSTIIARLAWSYVASSNGKPADEAALKGWSPRHEPAKASDFVYTRYAP
jgi:hypothetical protein